MGDPRRPDGLAPIPTRVSDSDAEAEPPRSLAQTIRSPGSVLGGKYRVLRKLGEGQMGEVFLAAHVHLDKEVALKVLRPELATNDASLERFLREARAAARVANDHVVRIFDVAGIEDREPFIVMEYLQGEDLARHLERGALSVQEAVGVLLQACAAISDVHRAGVIHRDLKPANLFLERSREGTPIVKLVDFGISKLSPRNGRAEVALTAKGVAVGTPLYMAPEQLDGAVDVDPRADVWALGVIFFEMLTGRAPFEDRDFLVLRAHIATAPTPRLSDVRPDLVFPPGLDDVLDRCLAKAPRNRCSDAGELARMLAPFTRHAPLPTLPRPVVGRRRMHTAAAPMPPRGEIASTLTSRHATWETPSASPDELTPRSTMVASARPSPLAIAALAVAVPVVLFAARVASCVSSLYTHDARTAVVATAPTTPPTATTVVVHELAPSEPPLFATSESANRPTPSPPPAPPASSAAPGRSDGRHRPPPGDEFGGRL